MWPPRLIVLQPTPYCNIDCSYCYLGNRNDRRLMPPAVLEAVRDKIFARLPGDSEATVVWHAGEPTTAPIAWYERACDILSAPARPGLRYALQSNGIGIDARWIEFFLRTGTDVSLSIDGPQRFHDSRRRTRNDRPTWTLAMRGLKRLQQAGFQPSVITVLHPDGLHCADEYYEFYRDHDIEQVSFSIDEKEGANAVSKLSSDDRPQVTEFILNLLNRAFRESFPLHVREVERIAQILAGAPVNNEQVEAWDSIVVAADGSVSTFSPEFMEVKAPAFNNFAFGNILVDDVERMAAGAAFQRAQADIAAGVAACRVTCRYFQVCGGGAPVNKFCESGDLTCSETSYCRLSIQTAADALLKFIAASNSRADIARQSEFSLASSHVS